MKFFLSIIFLVTVAKSNGQELFVYTEPASNMPSHSLSVKLTEHFVTKDNIYGKFSQRFMPQLMLGISKKIMVHIGGTISNMHTTNTKLESFNLYAKYRFLSKDEIHKHFRMAVFADVAATKAPFHYDEVSLMGDKDGIELGIIATQLWNRLAISGTVSNTQVLGPSRTSKVLYIPPRLYQVMNYAFSAGYLVLPKEYTDYKQTNLNLYTELLIEQGLDVKKYCVDLAPAMQLIFNSNSKLNIGYRFQLSGNMQRMANTSWLISFERTFLNALKHK